MMDATVMRADGVRCPRCFRWHGVRLNHDDLCDRCVHVMLTEHPDHPETPAIRASVEAQRASLTGGAR